MAKVTEQSLLLASAIRQGRDTAGMREAVGEKAFGLARLPEPWTPSFVVLTTSVCDALRAGSGTGFETALRALTNHLGCAPSERVIIRSSAQAEGLQCRGRLLSKICTADIGSMTATAIEVLADFEAERKPEERCALLVHRYHDASHHGHLSNEHRVGKEQRDFLAEITSASETRVVSLQAKKQVIPADALQGISVTQGDLHGALRSLARWIHLELGRVHMEWIANDGVLTVLQCDSEDDAPLHEPMAAWAGVTRPTVGRLSVFELVNSSNAADLRKTRSLGIFQQAELGTTPVYMLRGAQHLESFDADENPSADVLADLAMLMEKRALVLRIDVRAEGYSQWQNLPAKVPARTVDEAVSFLRAALDEYKSVPREDLAIVAHHFIPARAAAWSECNLSTTRVRIDATWGAADGLQTFPCDTFYIDLRGDETTTYLRYKDEFLDVGSDTNLFRHRAAPVLALQPVLSNDDAFQIARHTQKIVQITGRSTRVMWFVEADPGSDVAPLFPWIIDDCEESADAYLKGTTDVPRATIPGTVDHARRLLIGNLKRIESPADLEEFVRSPDTFDLGGNRVVFRPNTPKNIRSRDFVRGVGAAALKAEWTIVLEGSTLTHNYYLLREQGVNVESAAEYLAEPRRRRIFGKLVRDKVPESILAKGEQIESRSLNGAELRNELLRKLVEEAFEAATATTDAGVVQELADISEVIRALLPIINSNEEALHECVVQKRAKRGGFAKGVFLVSTGGETQGGATTRQSKYIRVDQGEAELKMNVPLVPPDAERLEELASSKLAGTRVQISATYGGDQVVISVRRDRSSERGDVGGLSRERDPRASARDVRNEQQDLFPDHSPSILK